MLKNVCVILKTLVSLTSFPLLYLQYITFVLICQHFFELFKFTHLARLYLCNLAHQLPIRQARPIGAMFPIVHRQV